MYSGGGHLLPKSETGRGTACEKILEEWLLTLYVFSVAGWLWELAFTYIVTGQIVNRGFLHGPWLPVYGAGGILMLRLPRRWGTGVRFCLGALAGAAVEYSAAVFLETVYHCRWWDYAGWPGAMQGRVCLATMAVFGVLGLFLSGSPGCWVQKQLGTLDGNIRSSCCRSLSVLFAGDIIVSLFSPNCGPWVTFPL